MVSSLFLNPVGLLALLSIVPLVLLYIFRPDPREVEIPTMGFLPTPEEEGGSNPVVDRLKRNRLLVLQITVLALLSLALASPYLSVGGAEHGGSTVLVVDAGASMATGDGETRFQQAVAAAQQEVTDDTTVVVAGASASVELRNGGSAEASAALEDISVTDAESSLRSALSQANALAGEDTRVLVYSDFTDFTDWRYPVEQMRATGTPVVLDQYSDGGGDNVGFVDVTITGNSAELTVHNYGETTVDRTVEVENTTVDVTVDPESRETVSAEIPPGGATAELVPGDDFTTDDVVYLARHPEGALDVLLVTSDGGSVEAALRSTESIDVTVQSPPASSFTADDYDVVVFHDVQVDRLVSRNARDAREVAEAGGGVVFTAQDDLQLYGEEFLDLASVEPGSPTDGGTVEQESEHPVADGYSLPRPTEILHGHADNSTVVSSGGHPLLAEETVGDGRSIYLGYMTDASDFDASHSYPLFWRDLVHHAEDRATLQDANRETGETLDVGDATVEAPDGERTSPTSMEVQGFYRTSDGLYSANLQSIRESDVSADPVDETSGGEAAERSQDATVPLDLTPWIAVFALAFVVTELLYLRYRGDL